MKKAIEKILSKKSNILIFSLITAAVLTCATLVYFLCIKKYYPINSDEILLKRTIEGATNGGESPFAPVPYMVYINSLLGLILLLFYLIIPTAPWYFMMLAVVTAFAYTAILYKTLVLCRDSYKKAIAGFVLFVLLILICNYFVKIIYTEVAGLCAGASVFYCLCIDFEASKREKIFDATVLSILACFSILLRQEIGYITFAFVLAILLYRVFVTKVDIKKIYKTAIPVFCCLLIPFVVQTVVKNTSGYKAHTEYNQTRTEFFDYYGMPDWETDKEFYESIGIDYEQYVLIEGCTYIFDDVISEEQMKSIVEYQKEKIASEGFFGKIKATVGRAVSEPRAFTFTRSAYIILLFSIAIVVLTIIRKEYARLILIGIISLLSLAMFLYLCYIGRVPDRGVRPLFFIELLTILYFALTENYDFIKFKRAWLRYATVCGLIALTLPGAAINLLEDRGDYKLSEKNAQEYTAVREYILNNSDRNYIIATGYVMSEPVTFNTNSLKRMNYIGRSTWELHSPHAHNLYRDWGISGEMTVKKICDKDIAFVIEKESAVKTAFVDFVDKHYPAMQVVETDVITSTGGTEIGIYKVVTK